MNDTQLYLTIGIPSILIILAWISNKTDASALRGEINALRTEMRAEIAAVRAEMNSLRTEMRAELGAVRAEMARLAESLRSEMNGLRREIHADMVPLHERLAVVEAKQK